MVRIISIEKAGAIPIVLRAMPFVSASRIAGMLATTTALVLAISGVAHALWPTPGMMPMPLNQRWVVLLLGGSFLLIAWHSSGTIPWDRGISMSLGLGAAVLGLFIRQRLVAESAAVRQRWLMLRVPLATRRSDRTSAGNAERRRRVAWD